MEQCKNFWISGHATPGYPGAHTSTPGATVLYQRPENSVVELTKLNVHDFELENRAVAELIGLELARLIVDTCYPELQHMRWEIEQRERQTKENMVKLPLILHNAGQGDWKDILAVAHGKLDELQRIANIERYETGRYVRPILLVSVERTGKDQTQPGRIHANDVRRFLHVNLGARESEVEEESSAEDELTAQNLMDDTCPVRFIITKDALREG